MHCSTPHTAAHIHTPTYALKQQQNSAVYLIMFIVKNGLSLKIKKLHIHLYFIATQYL